MTALPQHLQALQDGNVVREGAAAIIRETRGLTARDAALRIATALEYDRGDPVVGAIKIGRFLRAVRYLGERKVLRGLAAAGVPSADIRVRDLSDEQCALLVFQLEVWADQQR